MIVINIRKWFNIHFRGNPIKEILHISFLFLFSFLFSFLIFHDPNKYLLQIDYPDAQFLHPGQRQSCSSTNLERLMALEHDEIKVQNSRGRSSVSDDRNLQQSYSDSEVCEIFIYFEYFSFDILCPIFTQFLKQISLFCWMIPFCWRFEYLI